MTNPRTLSLSPHLSIPPHTPVKSIVATFTLLALSTLAAQAQRKVLFRTLCLEHRDGVTEAFAPSANPEQPHKVPLYTSGISPVFETTFPTSDAALFVDTTDANGKPQRKIVAKGSLANGERQLFILIPSTEKDGPTYQIRAYPDDTKAFALGSVMALNLSPVPIRFEISGSTTPEVPANKVALFPTPKKVNEYNMYPVAVEFKSGNGQWIRGQSTSWKASERKRDIVVTLVDMKFKQPQVRLFTDIPPWTDRPNTP